MRGHLVARQRHRAGALTFSCGDSEDPDSNVYILADRVIASL
ncbi:hypothetical protein ABT237_41455 [Streptomyces sp. NPDC001581]